jgi:hypothetical protein
MDLLEVPMLEETVREWERQIRREERREGEIEMRKMLLQQMTLRFGRLPKKVRQRVEAISSTRELQGLGRKVVLAKSLQDLGLG